MAAKLTTKPLETYWSNDRRKFLRIVGKLNPQIGAIAGVRYGQVPYWLFCEFRKLKLYLIDNWEPSIDETSATHYDLLSNQDRRAVRQRAMRLLDDFQDRSILVHHSPRLFAGECTLERSPVDFVYIDYELRKSRLELDLPLWWGWIRPGGMLIGTGCRQNGARRYKDDEIPHYAYELAQAVNGFAKTIGNTVQFHLHTLWSIQKGEEHENQEAAPPNTNSPA